MQVVIPEIAQNIDEAEILALLVRVGQHVLARQPVLELEAGKASFELASPATGRVEAILVGIGDDVRAGDVVLTMRTQDPALADPLADPRADPLAGLSTARAQPQNPPLAVSSSAPPSAPPPLTMRASPAARLRAEELGVDLEGLAGASGRVTVADVEARAAQAHAHDQPGTHDDDAIGDDPDFGPRASSTRDIRDTGDTRETSDARELREIRDTSDGGPRRRTWGHRHVHELVDITCLDAARRRYHEHHEGPPLRLISFVLKACAIALREFPRMNSSLIRAGRALAIKRFVHLGVPVPAPSVPTRSVAHLPVPTAAARAPASSLVVLEHADQRPIAELAAALAEAGSISGSTSGSISGSISGSTAGSIVAPTFMVLPIRALGDPWTHSGQLGPLEQAGALVLGRLHRDRGRVRVTVQLAYDPRIHDQAGARAFLARVTEFLADPFALLMRT